MNNILAEPQYYLWIYELCPANTTFVVQTRLCCPSFVSQTRLVFTQRDFRCPDTTLPWPLHCSLRVLFPYLRSSLCVAGVVQAPRFLVKGMSHGSSYQGLVRACNTEGCSPVVKMLLTTPPDTMEKRTGQNEHFYSQKNNVTSHMK